MLNRISEENLEEKNIMNINVIANYSKLKLTLFFLPLFFLTSIVAFLYSQNALSVDKYLLIQKNCFYFINSRLSQFPNTIYNLTQVGDALIFLSFLTIFIVYAPKMWESLLSASLVSAIFSRALKDLFHVPRPAQAYDDTSFVIIGKTLPGFSSLPSGHSITVFTILTVLLFAFMPKKLRYKFLWSFLIIITGLILVFTRVGVGAHHPLDVITGSIIGYICGLIGIFISRKYKIWDWINNKKYYPVFIALFLICCIVLLNKINNENLIVFYLSLTSLVISLFKIITVYVKK
ncbi:phosphatase PAP2 family protein [Flavobacterium paronense]|uniref:Phosphatase PAP2 family protein n=1 Tax=Flavobacterium paronense TaxID=1392775 RepID=A0ABV5GHZ4_9FLAO|nr:phosphatase PAP2 family protein [Flavobacterium paronense]MDN3677116.1 phosphatase PAP2 family protein [Flavobacterium paronense]